MGANRIGAIEALTLMAPVQVGGEVEARAAIGALPAGDAGPFARFPGTHLVRVQVLRPPTRRFSGPPGTYLLLAADVDAPLRDWLHAACATIPAELDAVLRHCALWPGAAMTTQVERWVQRHRLPVGFSVIGSPDATVDRVRAALALRARLRDLAVETEGAAPPALLAAWQQWRRGA
jgi:hypothetical protein